MTSYLIGQGHRKIAFFGDQQHPMGSSLYRFRGLQKAMEEHKLEFDKDDYFYLPNMIITGTKCCGSLHKT